MELTLNNSMELTLNNSMELTQKQQYGADSEQ